MKFHPLDDVKKFEDVVYKLDVTKDSVHFVILKDIPEFVMFRHIVSDSIEWMEYPFPEVPQDVADIPKYTADLKLWLQQFLHDGTKLTVELLFALLTFFRVSENLGMMIVL